MVPQNVLDTLIRSMESTNKRALLKALGLRSRVGKGPCQGTFCSQRIAAYLYSTQNLLGTEGLETMKAFLQERWRGQHPMLWDQALAQADLFEALHCNQFGFELITDDPAGAPDAL
jgi:glycerol-3-phosphate dehydrogenase